MRIYLNDELMMTPIEATLEQALKNLENLNFLNAHHYAVLVNDAFIPRSLHKQTILHPEDRVELIIPMQGG